jgi:hypothetical protein
VYAGRKGEKPMQDIIWMLFDVIIIMLLLIECWILHVWAKEHAELMAMIKQQVVDIKDKMK